MSSNGYKCSMGIVHVCLREGVEGIEILFTDLKLVLIDMFILLEQIVDDIMIVERCLRHLLGFEELRWFIWGRVLGWGAIHW